MSSANATLDTPPAAKAKTVRPPVERMALRIDEVAASMGVSRRTIERERSAGRFPKQDLVIGKMSAMVPRDDPCLARQSVRLST